MAFVNFIVEPEWVNDRLSDSSSNMRLVEATWEMLSPSPISETQCIDGACKFDLDEVAAPHPSLKHMLPSADQFEKYNQDHGIKKTDHVICYDHTGPYSSPRLWWTYRMFGHEKVSVLNSGIYGWKSKGFPAADEPVKNHSRSKYQASNPLSGVIGFDELKSLLGSTTQIIDARSRGRFHGEKPEPRPGLRSGHMPGAISLPFESFRSGTDLEDIGELAERIAMAGIDLDAPIVTTCGSGITATGLALVFHQLGAQNVRVYDASWAEWGASDSPIEI